MLAADTLASYGSLARFKDVQRLNAVGEHTVMGAGGEFSDFQAISEMLEKLDTVRACIRVCDCGNGSSLNITRHRSLAHPIT